MEHGRDVLGTGSDCSRRRVLEGRGSSSSCSSQTLGAGGAVLLRLWGGVESHSLLGRRSTGQFVVPV